MLCCSKPTLQFGASKAANYFDRTHHITIIHSNLTFFLVYWYCWYFSLIASPTINLFKRTIYVKEGDRGMANCHVGGTPQPQSFWFRQDSQSPIINSTSYLVLGNNSLVFINMTSSMATSYTCKAFNEVGTINVTTNIIMIGRLIDLTIH